MLTGVKLGLVGIASVGVALGMLRRRTRLRRRTDRVTSHALPWLRCQVLLAGLGVVASVLLLFASRELLTVLSAENPGFGLSLWLTLVVPALGISSLGFFTILRRTVRQIRNASVPGEERWTPKFGQVVKVGSRPRRRSLACHGSDGVIRLS